MPWNHTFQHHVNIIMVEDEKDAVDFGREFVRRFETCKLPVYFPPRDTPAGTSYFDSLFTGIDTSKHTVVFLTPEFLEDNVWIMYCYRSAFLNLDKCRDSYKSALITSVNNSKSSMSLDTLP